jgi:plastocyanin
VLRNTRVVGMFAALSALLLLAGCGSSSKSSGNGSTAAVKAPVITTDIQLVPDEKTSSFNKSAVTAKQGTIKITVTNPSSNTGQHGVGINGGSYKNVAGAPVKPGRATSLTVAVKPGKYTIYDSYGNNKSKGYVTKLTVSKN